MEGRASNRREGSGKLTVKKKQMDAVIVLPIIVLATSGCHLWLFLSE